MKPWKAAAVPATCCASSRTTPPRSPATAHPEYQRAKPLRLPHSTRDFIIVEGYDGQAGAAGEGAAAAARRLLIAHVDVSDPEGYKGYTSANQAAFGKYGGRYLRGATARAGGGKARARTVVLEFPAIRRRATAIVRPSTRLRWSCAKARPRRIFSSSKASDGPQS